MLGLSARQEVSSWWGLINRPPKTEHKVQRVAVVSAARPAQGPRIGCKDNGVDNLYLGRKDGGVQLKPGQLRAPKIECKDPICSLASFTSS